MMSRTLRRSLKTLGWVLALFLILFGGLVALTKGSAFAPGMDDLMGQGYWYEKNTVVPRN